MRIAVYDLLGRKVAILVDESKSAGTHHTPVGVSTWQSGVYFIHHRPEESWKHSGLRL